ncbi:hypothetical protein EV360DRAFT_76655 [Lentinula raphanica]|nr:hypothetical protein EV360DRAFT_76655 [Lentinula raphanica]
MPPQTHRRHNLSQHFSFYPYNEVEQVNGLGDVSSLQKSNHSNRISSPISRRVLFHPRDEVKRTNKLGRVSSLYDDRTGMLNSQLTDTQWAVNIGLEATQDPDVGNTFDLLAPVKLEDCLYQLRSPPMDSTSQPSLIKADEQSSPLVKPNTVPLPAATPVKAKNRSGYQPLLSPLDYVSRFDHIEADLKSPPFIQPDTGPLPSASSVKVDDHTGYRLLLSQLDSTPQINHMKAEQGSSPLIQPDAGPLPAAPAATPVKVEDCSGLQLLLPSASVPQMIHAKAEEAAHQIVSIKAELDALQVARMTAEPDAPQVARTTAEPESSILGEPLHAMAVSDGEQRIIKAIRALIDEERAAQLKKIAGIESIRDVLRLELEHRERYIVGLRQLLADQGVTPPSSPLLETQKHYLHI